VASLNATNESAGRNDIQLMARTVRGIESVAAAEAVASLAASEVVLGHRQVTFRVSRLTAAALEFGTADDVFLVLLTVGGVGHRRSDLTELGEGARDIDGAEVVSLLRPLREVRSPVAFDVVASFLGRRNLTASRWRTRSGPFWRVRPAGRTTRARAGRSRRGRR
jgi:hypothetical protein